MPTLRRLEQPSGHRHRRSGPDGPGL